MKKKSQAKLIVVVLIVLLVLILAAVLWGIVIPLITDKSNDVSFSAVSAELDVKSVSVFLTGASRVNIEAGSGVQGMDQLRFIFYDNEGNTHTELLDTSIQSYEKKSYYFPPMNELGKIVKVSVVPVFNGNSGREFSSEISDVYGVSSEMISWWGFDSFEDLVGSNDCSSGNLKSDDVKGSVAEFVGNSIDCGDNDSLTMHDKLSICFWIKTNTEDGTLIKKGNNYEVSLNQGYINFSCNSGSFVSNSKVSDDNWNYIVITGMEGKFLKIYVNGVLDAPLFDFKSGSLVESSDDLIIGENYNGFLDEVMLYDDILATPQIDSLMKNTA